MNEADTRAHRIAIFGAYSDHDLYQRNRTLVKLFEQLSEESIRIRPRSRGTGHGFSVGRSLIGRVRQITSDVLSLWSQRSRLRGFDTIFVPYPAYLDILCLWLFGQLRGRRLIADAFLELHSTVVEDRALIPAGSLRARGLRAFQRFSLSKADVLLIDTVAQGELLRKQLEPAKTRVIDVPVGIDENLWSPLAAPEVSGRIRVVFWGTFIPLHGIEHIVAAARLLESRGSQVEIRLIGDGQTAEAIAEELKHQRPVHLRWDRTLLDTDDLRAAISEAHLVLGVFGDSAKASSVVPYKVHQALACNRPVITRSSPALNAVSDPERGLFVCPPGDAEAIADLIDAVCAGLRAGWIAGTREIYEAHFSSQVISKRLELAMDRTAQ